MLWQNLVYLIGEITIVVIIGIFFFALVLVALSIYSINTGRLYFPRFLKAGMVLVEGLAKSLFRLFGLEDSEVLAFFINLHNTMNKKSFSGVPVTERAIFFPQCLRSSRCPAHLSPEGLKCRSCGDCPIGFWKKVLEKMGYRVFIVPGSSFIKRMVKKYHPHAILGVGCLSEVKEGLEMSDKMGLVAMGVVTLKDGCVETLVAWDKVMEVATLGVPPDDIPPEVAELNNCPLPGEY
ncbi:MAG: hypothetical protein A4E37_02140 [Methanoregulaceae archaeon PtaB.Bin056]|jgi:hypothetical protein|nr:MAG: hypothetical protein A4E37_02140 [Methanoregulaceae archaeon PtaB.Bin056]